MAEKTDYSGNSQQAKAAPAEKPAVEKVVSGAVKVKKKPFGQKFRETFLATDAKTAASYVIDPQGQLRLFVKHTQEPAEIAADIRQLIG